MNPIHHLLNLLQLGQFDRVEVELNRWQDILVTLEDSAWECHLPVAQALADCINRVLEAVHQTQVARAEMLAAGEDWEKVAFQVEAADLLDQVS